MKRVLLGGTAVSLFLSSLVVLTLVVSLLTIQTAKADELYGRVRGVVSDATGAILPGVQLKLKNTGTGIEEEKASEADGGFVFVNLKPGEYSLTATKANFKTFQVSGIRVEPNQIYVQTVTMEVGGVSETIEVAANPAQVEQTSIQLTSTISSKTVTDLPLVGRNWITLQQTLPGVVTPDTRFGTNYSTNGSQAQQNSYLVNGNDNNDLPLNSPLVVPNPDSIEEIKMVTSTINPEFGRNSGGILNAITKSGTNSLHGTAFEFYRDTFMNTHSYFSQKVPIFHQNLFGGTIGGPIWKNKVFFFFSAQITRARQPDVNAGTNTNITVFTQAQLNGQFDPAKISTKPIPFVGGIQGPNGNCPQGSAWNACFTGGAVPTADFNTLSAALVKQFVPLPTSGNKFAINPVTQTKTNQYIGRLDYNITQKDSIWFYSLANDSSGINTIPFSGSTLPGFGDQSTPFTKQFTASWSHVFSTNVLNELRAGYTRLNFLTGVPNTVRQPASVGFPNIIPQLASGADYPQISITGYFRLGGTSNGPQPRKDQTYQVTDNFSWVKGRHTMKFGYDGRKFQIWNPFANSNDGVFSFSKNAHYSTGDAGLDFLLGIPSAYSQGSGSIIIAQAYEHYVYAQDQWRVKNNLTLTFGAGYQIDTPLAEYQDGGISRACFQPGVQSTVFATAPVGYTFVGDPGCNKYGGASTKYNHIGPRAGFAYTPDWGGRLGSLTGGNGKTSIRGGFGLYFNRGEEELNLQDLGIPPFGLTTPGVAVASNTTNLYVPSFPNPFHDIASGFSIPNTFPYVPPAAGAKGVDFAPFLPLGISVIPKNFTTPHAFNYNLTIERELPSQMILRVGYVGSHGSKLITSYTFNPTTPAGVQSCLAIPACKADGGLNLPVQHPDFLEFPGNIFGNSGQQTNGGFSNYNSLQVTLEKHMSHGLQFLSAYTYSHALDVSSSFEDTSFQAAGGVDPYGRFGRDYGSSAFDARHRWVLTLDYEVPSLKRIWSAVPGRLVEGWRLTGINAIQAGFPINLQDSNGVSLTCSENFTFYACPDRPNLVFAPKRLDPRTATFNGNGNYYFDPSAFTDNPVGTLGNVGRGFITGPRFWNTDFSIQKDTRITEGKTLQLRLEGYNLFNHTNFGNPSGDLGAPGTFGQIQGLRRNTNSRLAQIAAKFIF
jgi:carboxypeptidase family protein